MNYKICTKCDTKFPATKKHFHTQQRGLYGLRSSCIKCTNEASRNRYVPVIIKTEKCCNHCKTTLPLTDEYFYKKITKKGTIINGYAIRTDSISFKHICKSCHNKDNREREVKKIMIKHNLKSKEELLELKKNNFKQSGIKRQKYPYPEDCVTIAQRKRYRSILDMGYNPETYSEEWKKKWFESTKAKRKYNYGPEYENKKVPGKLINKECRKVLTDGVVCNIMRKSVKDLPKEIIEIKRTIILLKREIRK